MTYLAPNLFALGWATNLSRCTVALSLKGRHRCSTLLKVQSALPLKSSKRVCGTGMALVGRPNPGVAVHARSRDRGAGALPGYPDTPRDHGRPKVSVGG
jgi:hypothetical protein